MCISKSFKSIFIVLSILFFGVSHCTTSSNSKSVAREKSINPKTTIQKISKILHGEGSDPRTYRTIHIQRFSNPSTIGSFTQRLKEKLEIAYNSDGRLKLETVREEASIWLSGTILYYQKIPIRYNQFNQPIDFRMSVISSIKLMVNPKISNQILLSRDNVRYDISYHPLESPFESEFLAHERLLDGLVDRLVYTSFKGWYSDLKTAEELNKEKSNSNLIDPEAAPNRRDIPLKNGG